MYDLAVLSNLSTSYKPFRDCEVRDFGSRRPESTVPYQTRGSGRFDAEVW